MGVAANQMAERLKEKKAEQNFRSRLAERTGFVRGAGLPAHEKRIPSAEFLDNVKICPEAPGRFLYVRYSQEYVWMFCGYSVM